MASRDLPLSRHGQTDKCKISIMMRYIVIVHLEIIMTAIVQVICLIITHIVNSIIIYNFVGHRMYFIIINLLPPPSRPN